MSDRVTGWLRRGALALLMGVVVVLLVLSVVVEPSGVEPESARWWRGLGTAAVMVAFVLILRARAAAFFLEDRGLFEDSGATARPATGRSVVAILLTLFPLVANAPMVRPGLEAGLAPAGPILAAVASAAAVVTVVVLAVVPSPYYRPPPRRRWLAAVPAAAATVALVATAAIAVPAADATLVHASPVAEPMAATPVPDTLGRVAWTKELAPRERSRQASPIAGGLALEMDDATGVVALDGATGDEQWTYRRSGAQIYSLFPADDGRLLVVLFGHVPPGRSHIQEWSWTLLDAMTGGALHGPHRGSPFAYFGRDTAVIGDVVLTNTDSQSSAPRRALALRENTELWSCERADCGSFVGATGGAFVFASSAETGGRFHAIEASTGRELWSYQHESSCDLQALNTVEGDAQPVGAVDDVVVGYCADTRDVVGLDASTGDELWARELDGARTTYAFSVAGAVNLIADSQDDGATRVIDPATGELLDQMPWFYLADARVGDTLVVSHRDEMDIELRDLGTGETTELDDYSYRVTEEYCMHLSDGLHCALPYDREHVTSIFEDGTEVIRDWNDLGVPPGLGPWITLWTPARHSERLFAVGGAIILGSSVTGENERQVLVGLVP